MIGQGDRSEATLPEDRLKHIADKIRLGQIVLWTGAAFNCIAPLPTGRGLVDAIRSHCTAREREDLGELGYCLPLVAERFVRMRYQSKSELVSIVKEVLSLKTPNLKLHDYVRDMVQIRDIVTTNYDSLLERSIDDLGVAFADTHLPLASTKSRHLFKIHGDLSLPESLVITDSDVAELIDKPRQPLLWAAAMSVVAASSVLFIGYSLEDLDVRAAFDRILMRMTVLHPESYLVVPVLPQYEKARLSRLGIEVIDSDAETALEFIHRYVMEHLIQDCLEAPRNVEELVNLLRRKGAGIEVSTDGKTRRLSRFEAPGTVTLSDQALKSLDEFTANLRADTLHLPPGSVTQAEIELADVQIPIQKASESEVEVERLPQHTSTGFLSFLDEPTFIVPVGVKTYFAGYLRVSFEHAALTLNCFLDPCGPGWSCKWKQPWSLQERYQGFRLVEGLLDGRRMQFWAADRTGVQTFPLSVALTEKARDSLRRLKFSRWLCEALIRVSSFFDVPFEYPDQLDEEDVTVLRAVESILDGRPVLAISITVSFTPSGDNELLEVLKSPGTLRLEGSGSESLCLFGTDLDVGSMTVDIPDPMILNEDDVRRAIEQGSQSIQVVVGSRSGQISLNYSRRSPMPDQ